MNSKDKALPLICAGTVALALLVAVSAPHMGQEPITQTHIRPAPKGQTLSAFVREDRVIPQPVPPPTLVDEEPANVEPDSTPPAEIDIEPQKPNEPTEISAAKEPPRGNPTPEPSPSPITATVTATEPQMGDTRIVDGQKQVYFLGFGWIEDNDEPNIGIVVDGDGDINKMVGTMDGGEVGQSCGDINKPVGSMD